MNIQTIKKSMALILCLALVSNDALARQRRRSVARAPQESRAQRCLEAVAAGEAGGHGERAQRHTMEVVMNRYRLGYGSSICGIAYARKQFAPRPGLVTARIRQLAAQVLRKGLASIASGPTHFHSYKYAYDRRAPWSRRMAYLGFDGAHHLFRLASVQNARLAAANQQNFSNEQNTDAPSVMASRDRNNSGLWTIAVM